MSESEKKWERMKAIKIVQRFMMYWTEPTLERPSQALGMPLFRYWGMNH